MLTNYTEIKKIKVTFKDGTALYIDDDELTVFKLSGDYDYIIYRNAENQLHRGGGLPAIEWADGSKSWYENGQCYRAGGLPAIEWKYGYKEWWENGKRIK